VCVLPAHEGHTVDQQTNRRKEGPCRPIWSTSSSTYTDASHHCNTHTHTYTHLHTLTHT